MRQDRFNSNEAAEMYFDPDELAAEIHRLQGDLMLYDGEPSSDFFFSEEENEDDEDLGIVICNPMLLVE